MASEQDRIKNLSTHEDAAWLAKKFDAHYISFHEIRCRADADPQSHEYESGFDAFSATVRTLLVEKGVANEYPIDEVMFQAFMEDEPYFAPEIRTIFAENDDRIKKPWEIMHEISHADSANAKLLEPIDFLIQHSTQKGIDSQDALISEGAKIIGDRALEETSAQVVEAWAKAYYSGISPKEAILDVAETGREIVDAAVYAQCAQAPYSDLSDFYLTYAGLAESFPYYMHPEVAKEAAEKAPEALKQFENGVEGVRNVMAMARESTDNHAGDIHKITSEATKEKMSGFEGSGLREITKLPSLRD